MDSTFASSLAFYGHAFFDIEGVSGVPLSQVGDEVILRMLLAVLLGGMLGTGRSCSWRIRLHAMAALAASTYITILLYVGVPMSILLHRLADVALLIAPVLLFITATLSRERTLQIASVIRFGMAIIVGSIAGFGATTSAIMAATATLVLVGVLVRFNLLKD